MTPEEVNAKAVQLSELIQETVRVTMSTGPKGFARAMQAAQSVAQLGQEYLLKGKLDPAPVLMRKLFEKLGATYIKLVSAVWEQLGCRGLVVVVCVCVWGGGRDVYSGVADSPWRGALDWPHG